ncbi:MAG: LysE/ArgO family amino acid transporter [Thalassotalea sp.]
MTAFLSGFSISLSLILAIGAQNAFVLKQGLKKQHVFLVCSICALSDAILIAAGISGFHVIIEKYPSIEMIARYGGAAFLILYSLQSFYSAWRNEHSLVLAETSQSSALKVASICLAFTWLNPHVYLDTVFLLGSISTQYEANIASFTLGAITSSFFFFFALGYGARLLIPFFQKTISWKILEAVVGLIMLTLAISLLW